MLVKMNVAWSCPTVCNPMNYIYSLWNSPGQNTGVGSLSLLQGIFATQGQNPGLLRCRQILYQLSHKGSPGNIYGYLAHCRQHNDVSLSYRDTNVSYLFDKWSMCRWEQADKVSRKACRSEGGGCCFFLKYPLPFNASSSRFPFRRRSHGSLPHCSGQCSGHCGEEFHKLMIKEIKKPSFWLQPVLPWDR